MRKGMNIVIYVIVAYNNTHTHGETGAQTE